MLPIYYDAEFTGLHKNTTFISIGLVTEKGSYFYAEFNDYDESQVDDWIQKHVINNLQFNLFHDIYKKYEIGNNSYIVNMKGCSKDIKKELLLWIENEVDQSGEKQAHIFTDCYAYDWVLFNDLICENGEALKIPNYINYIPIDLSTVLYLNNIDPDINREKFVGNTSELEIAEINDKYITKVLSKYNKHNSLWDAYIVYRCFDMLVNSMYRIKKGIN